MSKERAAIWISVIGGVGVSAYVLPHIGIAAHGTAYSGISAAPVLVPIVILACIGAGIMTFRAIPWGRKKRP
jgi:hypothetical protein